MSKPAIQLYDYQKAWVQDTSRFKIGMFFRQGGKSFGTSLEAVLDAVAKRTRWVFLSAGERQSKELMATAALHARAIGKAAEELESTFKAEDGTEYKQLEIILPNRSRIIGLPANPNTARGHSANVLLDEFAFHKDSRAIWRALFPTVTRGYKVRIISTPQGKQNRFYELWTGAQGWSKHKVDIHEGVAQGFVPFDEQGRPCSVEDLERAFDDPEGWQQEYLCQFIDEATAYLTYELIAACEDDTCLAPLEPGRELYLGMDVGRKRDLTIIWVIERLGEVKWTREVTVLEKAPFPLQREELYKRLPLVHRAAIDATGLGMQLAEEAQTAFGTYKVEPVTFGLKVKEDLAGGVRAQMEDGLVRIPVDRAIREDLHSVKKITTSAGNIRFDAEKTQDGHCYDAQTELLTAQGWKPFAALTAEDAVASLHDGKLVFALPTELQRFPYCGDMIRIENKQVDLLVTPHHRLYVRNRGGDFSFVAATELLASSSTRWEFKKDAEWAGEEVSTISVAGHDLPAALWLEFLGYFISQGFTSTENRVGIYGKDITSTPVRACVEALPWAFWLEPGRNGIDSYRTKDAGLHEVLSPQGRSWDRFVPRDVLSLSRGLLKVFFNALMWGNGRAARTTWSYYTSSRQLADDFQELLLRLGMAGTVSRRHLSVHGNNKRTMYEININRTRLTPQINKRRKTCSVESYEGEVFCCTVSSGLLYVRRNGKACWCGNSDRFWALALALHAASTPAGPIEYESLSKRRFSERGAW